MSFAGRILIPVPHGRLEAIYQPRAGSVDRIAVLLHPHPLYGGNMHNKVVYAAAKALEEAGWETLRFNFRGVDGSSGTHAGGVGEVEDARRALEFLRARRPEARRSLLFGFSFGAAVALRFAASGAGVDALIAVGTPAIAVRDLAAAAIALPVTFVHGERDDVAPLAALRDWLGDPTASPWPRAVEVIAGADHFFVSHLAELRAAVKAAVTGF